MLIWYWFRKRLQIELKRLTKATNSTNHVSNINCFYSWVSPTILQTNTLKDSKLYLKDDSQWCSQEFFRRVNTTKDVTRFTFGFWFGYFLYIIRFWFRYDFLHIRTFKLRYFLPNVCIINLSLRFFLPVHFSTGSLQVLFVIPWELKYLCNYIYSWLTILSENSEYSL